MIFDEGVQIAEPCPNCKSRATEYDVYYEYWKCEDCSTVWANYEEFDLDEPTEHDPTAYLTEDIL